MTNLEQLRLQIREANRKYWIDNDPNNISDVEYDRLVENLRQLSPNDPLLSELGHEKVSNDKVVHSKPLLSLDKRYSWREIISWCDSVSRNEDELFMVSPKYDGLSIEFLTDIISTRGDGKVGNNITHLANHIRVVFEFCPDGNGGYQKVAIPLGDYIDHQDDVYGTDRFVGELLISKRRFETLKHLYCDEFKDYKTCRNMVAGFANTKYSSGDSSIFGTTNVHIADLVLHRAFEIPVTLKELKSGRNIESEIMQFINNPKVNYPVDGIVLRLADDQYAESLGVTRHHPRGSMSYKFTSETVQVKVSNIEWQVGELHVTPVCEFEPTLIDGVMVSRATAHNAQWVEDNKIHVGSIITIERRGGVIPKVIHVVDDGSPAVKLPEWCPVCGGHLKRDGRFLICTNEDCKSRVINKIIRGLEVFGIKGVGPALAEKAHALTGVKNIMEWCKLFCNRSQENLGYLLNLKILKNDNTCIRFTKNELSTLTSVSEIANAGVTVEQLLASVCIPKCSTEFVTTVESKCGGIMNLLHYTPVDSMYDVIVDKCKLDAVTNFMQWIENHREDLLTYIKLFNIVKPKQRIITKGTICFTGTGPRSRKELQALAIDNDYECTENVSSCSILVAENPYGSSSKLTKAKKRGVQIINYSDFLKMMK